MPELRFLYDEGPLHGGISIAYDDDAVPSPSQEMLREHQDELKAAGVALIETFNAAPTAFLGQGKSIDVRSAAAVVAERDLTGTDIEALLSKLRMRLR